MKTLKHALLAAVAYGKGLPAKKLRNGLFVVAAFAGLAGLIALTDPPQSGAAASSGPAVTVLNTPLPVSGTVSANAAQSGLWNVGITGTPTVNVGTLPAVSISGTPTVSVSGMPTVSLAAGASFRDADNAARQPFQQAWSCAFTGFFFCNDTTSITVPTGKELVIEFVSVMMDLPTGQKPREVSVGTQQRGNEIPHHFPLSLAFDNGVDAVFAGAQQTRLYSDPSLGVTVQCQKIDGSVGGSCFGSISGYLVNVP